MENLQPLIADGTAIELIVRLALGALACVLAIVSWTRTRTLDWFFVIAAILASYAGTLYRALKAFGLFPKGDLLVYGASLGIILSDNFPILLLAFACFFYVRNRK